MPQPHCHRCKIIYKPKCSLASLVFAKSRGCEGTRKKSRREPLLSSCHFLIPQHILIAETDSRLKSYTLSVVLECCFCQLSTTLHTKPHAHQKSQTPHEFCAPIFSSPAAGGGPIFANYKDNIYITTLSLNGEHVLSTGNFSRYPSFPTFLTLTILVFGTHSQQDLNKLDAHVYQ